MKLRGGNVFTGVCPSVILTMGGVPTVTITHDALGHETYLPCTPDMEPIPLPSSPPSSPPPP